MNERVYYFDRLRIIAAIAVVVIHISAPELFRYGIGTPSWDFCNILDSFSRFAVPLFVMLSGAIFLNPEKKTDIKKLYSKNLLRIVVAFFFWSFFYALVNHEGDAYLFIKNVLLGHFHMYYLFIIAGLYIAVPIYRKICEDEKLMSYFLLLAFVFVFLLPLLATMPHMSVIDMMLEKMNFKLVLGYSVYFVGGYYFSRLELSKLRRWMLYTLGATAFVSTAIFTRNASVQLGEFYTEYYDGFSANVLIETVSLFVFAKYNLSYAPKSVRSEKILLLFSKLTFGVYLVHMLVFDYISGFSIFIDMSSVLLYIASKLFLTLLISGIISYILNKIPVLKKYIV